MTNAPPLQFPPSAKDFFRVGDEWWAAIREQKARFSQPGFDRYPFESLTALPVLCDLLAPVYGEIVKALQAGPLLDIGCADGDLSTLFARYGTEVDAVDCASTNFNGMAGVRLLSRSLGLPISVHNLDMDARFNFPRDRYGLTLFLGTLYHLKNPYYALETLAYNTEWCLLSTRIAQVTPRTGARIETEPVAYLADGREIGNDATNYWIFSATGLLRILQ